MARLILLYWELWPPYFLTRFFPSQWMRGSLLYSLLEINRLGLGLVGSGGHPSGGEVLASFIAEIETRDTALLEHICNL